MTGRKRERKGERLRRKERESYCWKEVKEQKDKMQEKRERERERERERTDERIKGRYIGKEKYQVLNDIAVSMAIKSTLEGQIIHQDALSPSSST